MSDENTNVWVGETERMHVERHGPETAPALVLLPPLGGSDELFAPFRAELARDFQVVTVEPPGSGDSTAPEGLPSTRAYARRVVDALDALDAPRAHLFGISLGGMIAQWIAIDRPERVHRLVLASTSARGLAPSIASAVRGLALARRLLAADEPNVALALEVAHADDDDPDERARITEAARAHAHDRRDLVWLAAAAAVHDAPVARIEAPTLVITGADDELVPIEAQRALASAIPHGAHVIVAGAGHDVTLDRPVETAKRVREFLAP